ncbi:MAG: helix-turn-helix transcriptional regulator [Piscinibacter sp.]|uniref:helix-turn-helix domain-containing protein n=1 Tax=Piscinibacter sp. TaxID=1903157 RepID=UPI00258BABDD|nr:helix-turn-helix transcriptional regulator [Piscinibacter sp.]MCW5667832.1 helix-turn-helix transcriptional regulator [Piscinibacter sp.]
MRMLDARPHSKLRPAASFGELLFELRQRAGLSQRELGRRTGLSNSSISEFENCRRAPPRRDGIVALALALSATEAECELMFELASSGRSTVGKLRIGRETSTELASLLREVFDVAMRLNDQQVAALRVRLKEAAM